MSDKRRMGRLEAEVWELTPREAEFLRLVGAGLTITEAAQEAFSETVWRAKSTYIKRRAVLQGPLEQRRHFLRRVLLENDVDADAFAKSVKTGLEKGDAGAQKTFL